MKKIEHIYLGREEYDNVLSFWTLWRISKTLVTTRYWRKYYKMRKQWFTRWDLADKAYKHWRDKRAYNPNALYFIVDQSW